jgi:hypothetical protein
VQLLEAAYALGDGCEVDELARLLGRESDDPDVTRMVALVARLAVAWQDGSRLRTVPLSHVWQTPLELGTAAATLLGDLNSEELRGILQRLGLPPQRLKAERLKAIVSWLSDPEQVRQYVEAAPPATRELLVKTAWQGPKVEILMMYPRPATGYDWARERGLMVGGGWTSTLEMPQEVALALRGRDYHAPFDPEPPRVPLRDLPTDPVERDAAATATAAVGQMAAVLDECAWRPVALLKSGGVGSRELRRLGKLLSLDPDHVRFWLDLGYAAGLAKPVRSAVTGTPQYQEWRTWPPAEQLVTLLHAWRSIEAAPLYAPPDGSARAALAWPADGALVADYRAGLLAVAAGLPTGRALSEPGQVQALLGWSRPMVADSLDDPAGMAGALWREAELLGLVARGAPSALGRSLSDGDLAGMVDAARRLLPAAETETRFQADLTAVVAGPPAAELTTLLNSAADLESRDSASTWRFSTASIRRAFDAGATGDDLVAALREVATGGRLPQALEYLVGDVARRHGAVRVREISCCLRSDDPALISEILASRVLRPLSLTRLAPTVLGSRKPAAETLAALRDAGYFPTEEGGNGAAVVRHVAPGGKPAKTAPQPAPPPAARPDLDVVALARELLAAGVTTPDVPDDGSTLAAIRAAAPQLSPAETRILAYAIDEEVPVHINYVDGNGRPTSRVVEGGMLDSGMLIAWCRLREDERMFALSRIQAVSPGPGS